MTATLGKILTILFLIVWRVVSQLGWDHLKWLGGKVLQPFGIRPSEHAFLVMLGLLLAIASIALFTFMFAE
jgi:hypothetical protein